MPTINDANGQVARVNVSGHLETEAITHSAEHFANHITEEAYQVPFSCTPDDALDCFFYLKNNSDLPMVIEGFSYHAASAETVYVEIANTGTPTVTNGATLVPVNCNAGSGKTADATCHGGLAAAAVDIDDMATGREIERLNIVAAADKKWHNFEMDVILPKNTVFTLWCLTGSILVTGTVVFYYHSSTHA